tara:strand:- start:383 stop:727 length:345 start_codon:yes stop_codon:yes gene_type:complete
MLYQGVTVDTGDDIFLKGTIELPNNNPDTNDIGKYFSGISISYEEWNKIAADLQKDDRIAFDLKDQKIIHLDELMQFSAGEKLDAIIVMTAGNVNILRERPGNVIHLMPRAKLP